MSEKTVFVIGAGASNEVGLPIGSQLKDLIIEALSFRATRFGVYVNGNETLNNILASKSQDQEQQNQYVSAALELCEALQHPQSIDHLLEIRKDNELIVFWGKLAIVRTILQAELTSKLSIDQTGKLNFSQLDKIWFKKFFQKITENCSVNKLEDRLRSITIIIFNYDRCVEHYLYYALQDQYSINHENTISLLQNIEIYHPYGSVGALPWQGSGNVIEYGEYASAAKLIELAQQIKTFTEGIDGSSGNIKSIRSRMKSFDKLIFLGFSFGEENMELLLPLESVQQSDSNIKRSVYATSKNLSDNCIKNIGRDLISRYRLPKEREDLEHLSKNLKFSSVTCHDLFEEYSREFSFKKND